MKKTSKIIHFRTVEEMSDGITGIMQSSPLMELFKNELKDIYWAEMALTKAIPKLRDNSTSFELVEALDLNLEETYQHVERLQEIFLLIKVKPDAKKCRAIQGLISDVKEIIKFYESGAIRDAGIIAIMKKVEHYEIASYGTMRQFADVLGFKEVSVLLTTTLHDEHGADEILTEITAATINVKVAS